VQAEQGQVGWLGHGLQAGQPLQAGAPGVLVFQAQGGAALAAARAALQQGL
jgi:hypothetical protein